jgi:hypothetical protein
MSTSIVIGPCRLSFFHGWEPKAPKGSTKLQYSTQVLIDVNDKKNIDAINQAINEAREEGKDKLAGVKANKLRLPLYDGEDEFPGDPNYAGMMYVNASNTRAPEIVKKKNGKITPIIEEDEMYSGVYAFVHVNFFAYNNVGQGVGCSLQSIMKYKDGERLDSRINAEKAFESVDFETEEDATGGKLTPTKKADAIATAPKQNNKKVADAFADDEDGEEVDPFAD